MRPEDKFGRLLFGPRIAVSNTSVISFLVDFGDGGEVGGVWGRFFGSMRGFEIESILKVTSGVLLGHKEGIKVPEGGFDKSIGWHLFETVFTLVNINV